MSDMFVNTRSIEYAEWMAAVWKANDIRNKKKSV